MREKTLIIFASLVAFLCPQDVVGQPALPAKLTCVGTLQIYGADPTKADLKSIYLKVDGAKVEIRSSVGFDATYTIVESLEHQIQFIYPGDPLYVGFLRRFSGELSLVKYKDKQQRQLEQMLTALCAPATPLF